MQLVFNIASRPICMPAHVSKVDIKNNLNYAGKNLISHKIFIRN
jgi:hypothetical protein